MPEKQETPSAQAAPSAPISTWLPPILIGWLVPGGGHFYLNRRGRGMLLAGSVILMFVFGLMMHGSMFQPTRGDLLTTIIYYGGFIGDLASGLLYLVTVWMGYNQPEMAGHVADYGTKFLVAAGLLNILAIEDAYEIAIGRRD